MIRVASYNVRGLKDDRAALARVIATIGADVLCVQEVPPIWAPGRRRALARLAGMRLLGAGRGATVGVLVRPGIPVVHAQRLRLRRFAGLEWRSAAVVIVRAGGVRVAVVSVHLDLHGGARLSHTTEIVAEVGALAARWEAIPVIAGDINEEPGGPAWRYLARRYTDAFAAGPYGDGRTFTARTPDKRIDAIFVGSPLTVGRCGEPGDLRPDDLRAATDHRPVVADLGFRQVNES